MAPQNQDGVPRPRRGRTVVGRTPSPRNVEIPDLPEVGDDRHLDMEQALRNIHMMIAAQREESGPHVAADDTATADTFTLWGRIQSALGPVFEVAKWVGGAAVLVFTAGIAYQQFIDGNATIEDVEARMEERVQPIEIRVEPLERRISEVEVGMNEARAGVQTLVDAEKRSRVLEHKRALLEAYRSEYQEALQEYTADKAAGRRSARPRKTEAHIQLEAELRAELKGL